MKKAIRDQRIVVVLERNPRMTLQEIADELKVTRQRIGLITKKFGVDNQERMRKRRELKKEAANKAKFDKYVFWKKGRYYPATLVRDWLKEINHGYCCQCFQAKPLTEFNEPRRCAACVSRNTSLWWRKSKGYAPDYEGRKGPLRTD